MGAQPTPCESGVEHCPWSSGHPSRAGGHSSPCRGHPHRVVTPPSSPDSLSVYPPPLTSHLIHFSASSHPSTSLTHVEHRPSLSLHPPSPPSLVGGGCRRCCGGDLRCGSGWARWGMMRMSGTAEASLGIVCSKARESAGAGGTLMPCCGASWMR
jgi:hypothetical protein